MLHTMLITNKLSKKVYLELLSTLSTRNLKEVKNKNYITHSTGFFKPKGLNLIKLIAYQVKTKTSIRTFYSIEILVNPRSIILTKNDKTKILKDKHVFKVNEEFNKLILKINSSLPEFFNWKLKRIDFCTQIRTKYVKEYIELFQRGDYSDNFKMPYSKKAKRREQQDGSFYLENKSVKINFYDKEKQLIFEKEVQENEYITSSEIESAKDLLRLEIQCLKGKTDYIKIKEEFTSKDLHNYLSLDLSRDIITNYYKKTIGTGDFYKLDKAIKIIKDSKLTNKIKVDCIELLELSNSKRSVQAAKKILTSVEKVEGREYTEVEQKELKKEYKRKLSHFNYLKKCINKLNINLITIPRRWKVDFLINTLTEINLKMTVRG